MNPLRIESVPFSWTGADNRRSGALRQPAFAIAEIA